MFIIGAIVCVCTILLVMFFGYFIIKVNRVFKQFEPNKGDIWGVLHQIATFLSNQHIKFEDMKEKVQAIHKKVVEENGNGDSWKCKL